MGPGARGKAPNTPAGLKSYADPGAFRGLTFDSHQSSADVQEKRDVRRWCSAHATRPSTPSKVEGFERSLMPRTRNGARRAFPPTAEEREEKAERVRMQRRGRSEDALF